LIDHCGYARNEMRRVCPYDIADREIPGNKIWSLGQDYHLIMYEDGSTYTLALKAFESYCERAGVVTMTYFDPDTGQPSRSEMVPERHRLNVHVEPVLASTESSTDSDDGGGVTLDVGQVETPHGKDAWVEGVAPLVKPFPERKVTALQGSGYVDTYQRSWQSPHTGTSMRGTYHIAGHFSQLYETQHPQGKKPVDDGGQDEAFILLLAGLSDLLDVGG
jgi:hypothetical protein